MSETPRPVNPEITQTPTQEKAESFALSKLIECVGELIPEDYEYLESLIKDGTVKAVDAEKVRKAVEAIREVTASEDKNAALKKYVPILIDLIYARSVVDSLINKTELNERMGSPFYHLVDAIYGFAPDDVRAQAEDAVVKIDEESEKA